MWSFQKPTIESIRRFMAEESKLVLTLPRVEATVDTLPTGYVIDHTRIELGKGESVFLTASAALQHWDHLRLGWVEAWSPSTSIQRGDVVAVMARSMGLWWLNSCRIIYVINETGPISKFGFACGNLPGYAESGEERFMIEWHRGKKSVWYDLLSISRPNTFLTRLGYPVLLPLQKRFGRDSAACMCKAARIRDNVSVG